MYSYKKDANKDFPSHKLDGIGFHSRLASLIGKEITIYFTEQNTLYGKLLAFDKQHLNLCLSVNGKLVFIRGDAFLRISEGQE